MVGYRLSKTGIARKPYYIPGIAQNLWSVEELCWLLYEYPALIDARIVTPALTRWLAEEFSLTETALRMERGQKNGKGIADFLLPLYLDLGYLTPQELRIFANRLSKLEQAPAAARLKMKADALVKRGRYGYAISVYHQAAEALQNGDPKLEVELWHNSGTAAMQLLEYEEASGDFLRALNASGTEEALRTYLTAVYLAKPYETFIEIAGEMKASDSMLTEIASEVTEASREAQETSLDIENAAATLTQLRNDYHREGSSR